MALLAGSRASHRLETPENIRFVFVGHLTGVVQTYCEDSAAHWWDGRSMRVGKLGKRRKDAGQSLPTGRAHRGTHLGPAYH